MYIMKKNAHLFLGKYLHKDLLTNGKLLSKIKLPKPLIEGSYGTELLILESHPGFLVCHLCNLMGKMGE